MSRITPHHQKSTAIIDEVTTKRVKALVFELGERRARMLLAVGKSTLEAACDRGRMRADTRERLVMALDALDVKGAA